MSSRGVKIFRNIVGGLFALFGFSVVVVETWHAVILRHEPTLLVVTIAAVAIFVGGYIMWPSGTEQIADSLQERLPLRFGRRHTDVLATPKTVTITKAESVNPENLIRDERPHSSLGGE
jgi:hypothetical protein